MKKRTSLSIKKIVAGLLSLILVLGAAYTPFSFQKPEKAEALFGFGDIVIDPTNLVQNTVSAVADADQLVVSKILNGIAWSVAKMTIQSITRSTVNWINSGFQGSPAFVSDLRQNLSYLGDAVADDFFNHLDQEVISETGFTIKSPFQDQINQNLRNEFYRTTASYGINQYYTLYRDSNDPKAFIQQGKFSQGGFNAWFSASQNPANNPFGAYTLASSQLWAQIDSASKAREAELSWSKGFLPWRGNCGQTGGTPSLTKKDDCLFGAVKTPGSVIESQLELQLGSGIRQLELADSINEIVGALVGQMVNQVLGAAGLSGVSQPAPGGGQAYINTASNPNQYASASTNASSANGIIQNIKNTQASVTTYRDNWQLILDAATTAQKTCGNQENITTVLTQANANVTRANTVLQQSSEILTEVQNASQSTASDSNIAIATAIASYESYTTSANIPSAAEQVDSEVQSTDLSDARVGGSSLLTQMSDATNTCSRGRSV